MVMNLDHNSAQLKSGTMIDLNGSTAGRCLELLPQGNAVAGVIETADQSM